MTKKRNVKNVDPKLRKAEAITDENARSREAEMV